MSRGTVAPLLVGLTLFASTAMAQTITIRENREGTFSLPKRLCGCAAPVLGTWNAAGIQNLDARQGLAVNTCSGCHSNETGTPFLHAGTRRPGQPSTLSLTDAEESEESPIPAERVH